MLVNALLCFIITIIIILLQLLQTITIRQMPRRLDLLESQRCVFGVIGKAILGIVKQDVLEAVVGHQFRAGLVSAQQKNGV